MRYPLLLATVLAILVSVPAFAADGNVPQSTLDALGLAGMETVSDDDGMQVRGTSVYAHAGWAGRRFVTGVRIDASARAQIVDTRRFGAFYGFRYPRARAVTLADRRLVAVAHSSVNVAVFGRTFYGLGIVPLRYMAIAW
jgi:hypothetical protein